MGTRDWTAVALLQAILRSGDDVIDASILTVALHNSANPGSAAAQPVLLNHAVCFVLLSRAGAPRGVDVFAGNRISRARWARSHSTVYKPSHEHSKALLGFQSQIGNHLAQSLQMAQSQLIVQSAADGAADGVPSGAAVPSFLAGASPGSSTPVVLPTSAAAATPTPTPTPTPAPTSPPKPIYGTSCVLNLAGDFQKRLS